MILSIKRIKELKNSIFEKLEMLLNKVEATSSTAEGLKTVLQASAQNDGSLLRASIRNLVAQQRCEQLLFQLHDKVGAVRVQQQQQLQQFNQQYISFVSQQIELLKQHYDERTDLLATTIARQEAFLTQQTEAIDKLLAKLNREVFAAADDYSLLNPEVGLARYLYSYLPCRNALDIGANVGRFSECLLQTGYQVHAFEPYPPAFKELQNKARSYVHFHPHNLAIGAANGEMELHIAEDISNQNRHEEPSLFNSLALHPMLDDLKFTKSIPVLVRSLESLHASSEIPQDIGLVKIDTEGFDLEVIRGMGKYNPPVVISEFWDDDHPFGSSNAVSSLKFVVEEMQRRNYHWHIVIYRIGAYDAAFYCNYAQTVRGSWGNTFFFQSYELFAQALKWCSAVLPTTYFK